MTYLILAAIVALILVGWLMRRNDIGGMPDADEVEWMRRVVEKDDD